MGRQRRRTAGSAPPWSAPFNVAQDPAGNLKPAKDKSTERIDGIVALIMAIGRAMVAQEPQPEYSMFFV
jgi:phage terminase large subunit-like protein